MPLLHPCFLCLSEPPRLTDQERPFPCRQMYRGSKLEQGTAGDSVMPGNRAVLVLSHRLHTWHHLYQPRALFFLLTQHLGLWGGYLAQLGYPSLTWFPLCTLMGGHWKHAQAESLVGGRWSVSMAESGGREGVSGESVALELWPAGLRPPSFPGPQCRGGRMKSCTVALGTGLQPSQQGSQDLLPHQPKAQSPMG